ncbi:hypothetical protein L596_002573 [Steinernema carpocapsae]|uniref:BHLH domain-containing protein n=1 Tax=Steinernema carpocapsae TaxID=34508 RepID=A0A4U8USI0_STECR|nr:hypothetical protein L596_002573 [Steinernema carpocapsae]
MNYPAASYITAFSNYRNSSLSALTVAGLFPSFETITNPLAVQQATRNGTNPFSPEAKVPLPKEIEDLGYGTSVWKRNRRERDRVRCVNEGYETLRTCLPLAEHEKRISKVDTLRLAIFYIKHLDNLLKHENHQNNCTCFDKFQTEADENLQRMKLSRKRPIGKQV